MDLEAILTEMLEEETTRGMNMEISEEELLGESTACEIAASPTIASVTVIEPRIISNSIPCKEVDRALIKEAEVFCKTNTDENKYFDIRAERCTEIIKPVCKTTAMDNNSMVCKTTRNAPSICKTMEDDKENLVFPKVGDKRNSLCRFISTKTEDRIKAGSRRDRCPECTFTSSRRKMHVHVRQHYTKHFCPCGFRSTLYDTVLQHQQHDSCQQNATKIYEVDGDSYTDFLRHVRWRATQPFGKCTPVSDRGDQYLDTHQHRRPVRERLGRQYVAINHVRHAEVDELEDLERRARWHDKEAARYREMAAQWRQKYRLH